MNGWLKVEMVKPECPRDPDAFGAPVLIWPRNPHGNNSGIDGHCYYGRRATGKPAFYKYGAEILGVTHWMPMPNEPNENWAKTPGHVRSRLKEVIVAKKQPAKPGKMPMPMKKGKGKC